ncbi:MAG: RNB domain-containing ribonuclease [Blastocatellia bacterium]
MRNDSPAHIDLRAVAHRLVIEAGFAPDLPPAVEREVEALDGNQPNITAAPSPRDLRSLLWSSVDNQESRDLDQVEYVERRADGDIQVMVGIADVDAFVPVGSATDQHAAENATSVYTGVETFPMLPERLSTDITSLLGGVERLAVIIDMTVTPTGEVRSSDTYRARIHNYAKLDYESVGNWLEGRGPLPSAAAGVPGMEAQLRLQDEAADRLHAMRRRLGALDLETIEASPVTDNGRIVDLTVKQKNRARSVIEEFMVAANQAMAVFLMAKGAPTIQRVVRTPERWPRIVEIAEALGDSLPAEPDSLALSIFLARRKQADPDHFPDLSMSVVKLLGAGEYAVIQPGAAHEGHFGLAAHDYTHSTAPNRRFADLVTQRLIKAVTTGRAVPYTTDELARIADHCTERDRAAKKVERKMRKVAAAVLLTGRIGDEFDAIVTGVTPKGTFARLIAPPAEGRVVRGERGLDVGDNVRVRLVGTDAERGFIDFAAESVGGG